MTEVTNRKGRGTARSKGQEIVEGLRDLAGALKSDEPLGSRFTVRTYKIAAPPEYRGEGVRRVRELLGMSQAAFAAFLFNQLPRALAMLRVEANRRLVEDEEVGPVEQSAGEVGQPAPAGRELARRL